MTSIEWTQGDDGSKGETWNPVVGCRRVSPGCERCYAETMAYRLEKMGQERYRGLTVLGKAGRRWSGGIRLVPEVLDKPLRWRRPRRVFVTSMSDLFHESVSDDFIDAVFAVMALCPQHTFQNLTKRPARMLSYLRDPDTPYRVQQAIDARSVDEEMRGVTEEWRGVPGFPNYFVSNYGGVRSTRKTLRPRPHSRGYRAVCLRRDSSSHERLVHRLVLEAFDRPGKPGEEGRHRNGRPDDNRIANLSWGTKQDNMRDAARHGTAGAWMKSKALLDPATVESIRERRSRGEKLDSIAVDLGIDKRQVSAIANGDIYKQPWLEWPMSNLWLGVSTENQDTADERIPLLLQCPAAVRFVSAEPLLGQIDFRNLLGRRCARCGELYLHGETNCWDECAAGAGSQFLCGGDVVDRVQWVIVGSESGRNPRPMQLGWAASIVRQCREACTACFVKQIANEHDRKGGNPDHWPAGDWPREFPRVSDPVRGGRL